MKIPKPAALPQDKSIAYLLLTMKLMVIRCLNRHIPAFVLWPKNTDECGEASSPLVVIDVVIGKLNNVRQIKSPGQWFDNRPGLGAGVCVLVSTD